MTKQKDKDAKENHNNNHGKENSGGEPSKHAQALHADAVEDQQHDIDIGEGHDHKKGNIGPSGQGSHRGRERSNAQSKASGRPNISGGMHASH
ncbi:MAG: hypothetical protein EOP07_19985 [Proteobacteria bacterium]|nr:MAG: hypothetical protein EOP07_19985 [Pseudomonadota bacterium]RZI55218.1 MAG: hypothetical protein EOP14_06885 [Pseudomonas sp.]